MSQRERPIPFVAWIVLAAVLVAGTLSGCRNGSGLQPPPQVEQPFELSMMLVLHSAEPPKDTLRLAIEEKTGVKLNLSWVPDNVYTDKLISGIAAGSLPKVVQVKPVDLKQPTVVNAVRSGLFWEIGPYLHEYPLISKYLNPTIMDNGAYFGKYYGIYWELPLSRQGIQFRKDWLDRLGLNEPKTIDDLYEVMKAFAYRDPDGNGKDDTYGLVDRNDLVYGAFKNLASYFGAPNNWGEVDGKLVPDFMTKEYLDTMKFMKKLYGEKIINPDFPVTSKVQQEERFVNGQGGMMIGNLLAPSIRDRLKKVDPKGEVDIVNRIRGPKGERIWGGTGLGGLYLFPKTGAKSEDELKRILAFFDQTLTEEVNNLITYGIEGRHYKKLNEQTIKLSLDTKLLRKQEVEGYANALRTFDIRYLRQESVGELQEKVNRLIEDNKSIVVHDPAAQLISPTHAEKGTELQTIITDATYHFILSNLDEAGFAKELEKWRMNGGDRIIREMNEEYSKIRK